MKSARLCRQPDFARRGVAIDDDLRAVLELDLDDATGLGLEVEIGHAAVARRLKRRLDARQLGICCLQEFLLIHRVLPSFALKDHPSAMRPLRSFAAAMLALWLLAACGTKTSLTLPPQAQTSAAAADHSNKAPEPSR
jgi:predicted small lipoprotein YifL